MLDAFVTRPRRICRYSATPPGLRARDVRTSEEAESGSANRAVELFPTKPMPGSPRRWVALDVRPIRGRPKQAIAASVSSSNQSEALNGTTTSGWHRPPRPVEPARRWRISSELSSSTGSQPACDLATARFAPASDSGNEPKPSGWRRAKSQTADLADAEKMLRERPTRRRRRSFERMNALVAARTLRRDAFELRRGTRPAAAVRQAPLPAARKAREARSGDQAKGRGGGFTMPQSSSCPQDIGALVQLAESSALDRVSKGPRR